MEFRSFSIDGLLEVIPHKIVDDRGYFSETFRMADFAERVTKVDFVQENQSLSTRPGTIRGLHFQTRPAEQAKLVRCLAGKLFDIAVDLRVDSPTFRHWISVILSSDQCNQLWVPVGFAHGFCTLEPNTVISYRVTNYYSAEYETGVAWDDPEIAVEWPDIANPDTLSLKDRRLPKLAHEIDHLP